MADQTRVLIIEDHDVVSAVVNKPLEIDTLPDVGPECAVVVPPPEEPANCPPAENGFLASFDGSSYLSN